MLCTRWTGKDEGISILPWNWVPKKNIGETVHCGRQDGSIGYYYKRRNLKIFYGKKKKRFFRQEKIGILRERIRRIRKGGPRIRPEMKMLSLLLHGKKDE